MRTIVLNAVRLDEKINAHAYLKRRLKLPKYYGNNLDALYDVLTGIGQQTRILILRSSLAEGYADRVLETIKDAAEANPKVELRLL